MADRTLLLLTALCALPLLAAGPAQDASSDAQRGWSVPLVGPPEPHPSLALEPLATDAIDCARCHAEIAREWASTQHAHAWVDPFYQSEVRTRRRPESCYGCHIPEPLLQAERFGQKPFPRAEDAEPRAHGISCQSCHLGPDGAIHGPFGAPTDAHASKKDERFVGTGSNELCAACHRTTIGPVIGIAKDFEMLRLGERGMSCVACHMRAVERPIATEDGKELPPRAGRSHALATPRDPGFLAAAFELSARADGAAAVLRIENKAGHPIPGLVGRKLRFSIAALGAGGEELARAERTIDDVAYLPALGELEVRLDAPEAAEIRVTAEHHAPSAKEPIPFLEETLAVTKDAR